MNHTYLTCPCPGCTNYRKEKHILTPYERTMQELITRIAICDIPSNKLPHMEAIKAIANDMVSYGIEMFKAGAWALVNVDVPGHAVEAAINEELIERGLIAII